MNDELVELFKLNIHQSTFKKDQLGIMADHIQLA
jgi:hypothetical protein